MMISTKKASKPGGVRRDRQWRDLIGFALSACAVLSLSAFLAAPALANAGKRPVIVSTGSGVGGEITVEAQINPEGLETSYEIKLACGTCGPSGYSPSVGVLPAVNEALTVSLNLTGIKSGTYTFDVYASNTAGEALWSSQLKVPPVPPGACPEGCSPTEPYKPEVSQGSIESAEREADRITAQTEAERQRQAREYEEQRSQEAAALYAGESAALRAREKEIEIEEETATADTSTPACVVPSLKGDTLTTARRALVKAHCRLGKVHRPAHDTKTLLVARQNPRRGKRLPTGTTVGVTLGPERPATR